MPRGGCQGQDGGDGGGSRHAPFECFPGSVKIGEDVNNYGGRGEGGKGGGVLGDGEKNVEEKKDKRRKRHKRRQSAEVNWKERKSCE